MQALKEPLRTAIEAQARLGINQSAATANLLDGQAQCGDVTDQASCTQLHSNWIGRHEYESRAECQGCG